MQLVTYPSLLISVPVVQGLYSERLGGHYVGLYVVFSVFQYTLALDCTAVGIPTVDYSVECKPVITNL